MCFGFIGITSAVHLQLGPSWRGLVFQVPLQLHSQDLVVLLLPTVKEWNLNHGFPDHHQYNIDSSTLLLHLIIWNSLNKTIYDETKNEYVMKLKTIKPPKKWQVVKKNKKGRKGRRMWRESSVDSLEEAALQCNFPWIRVKRKYLWKKKLFVAVMEVIFFLWHPAIATKSSSGPRPHTPCLHYYVLTTLACATCMMKSLRL